MRGSVPSEFSSSRSTNVVRDTLTETFFHQLADVLAISSKGYLGIPVGDMLVTLPISFFTQRSDYISKGTQTLVDILRLFQPILIIPCPALLKPLRTSEIDEVERAFASIPTRNVLSR